MNVSIPLCSKQRIAFPELNMSFIFGFRCNTFVFLQVKERPDVGVYVKDLSAFVVNNADDMDRIMTLGNKNSERLSFFHF